VTVEKLRSLSFPRHVEDDLVAILRTGSVCDPVKDRGGDFG
jgi:hypothetical protein